MPPVLHERVLRGPLPACIPLDSVLRGSPHAPTYTHTGELSVNVTSELELSTPLPHPAGSKNTAARVHSSIRPSSTQAVRRLRPRHGHRPFRAHLGHTWAHLGHTWDTGHSRHTWEPSAPPHLPETPPCEMPSITKGVSRGRRKRGSPEHPETQTQSPPGHWEVSPTCLLSCVGGVLSTQHGAGTQG